MHYLLLQTASFLLLSVSANSTIIVVDTDRCPLKAISSFFLWLLPRYATLSILTAMRHGCVSSTLPWEEEDSSNAIFRPCLQHPSLLFSLFLTRALEAGVEDGRPFQLGFLDAYMKQSPLDLILRLNIKGALR